MVFGALYQIADGLFAGRFIGEDALAAVNIIMPIIFTPIFALNGVSCTAIAACTASTVLTVIFAITMKTKKKGIAS